MKKFRCVVVGPEGVAETRFFESKSKRALKEELNGAGLEVVSMVEEVRIVGGSVVLALLCLFFVPNPLFDTAFMSLVVVSFIGLLWVLSLLSRNPKRAVIPGILVLLMVAKITVTQGAFGAGLRDMKPKAQVIIDALENYRSVHGSYPKRLEHLVPRFLAALPMESRSLSFFPRGEGYQLVTEVEPFTVIYQSEERRWLTRYPT